MFRMLLFVSAATATVLILVRKSPRARPAASRMPSAGRSPDVVRASEAAERLRRAWGDYHTVA